VVDKVHDETVEVGARNHHTLWNILKQCLLDTITRKVELFYCLVFKGSKVPTTEELRRKIINYFIHHPELKPQNSEPWYCSKISPGFNHETMDCYLILSPKPLKKSDCSDCTIRYSSIELYNFFKKGAPIPETTGNPPKRFKLVWKDRLHHTHQTTVLLQKDKETP